MSKKYSIRRRRLLEMTKTARFVDCFLKDALFVAFGLNRDRSLGNLRLSRKVERRGARFVCRK